MEINQIVYMTTRTALAFVSLNVLSLASLLHAENPASDSQAANPAAALQGTWEGEEIGKESKGKWTMTINGDTLRFDGPGKIEWYTATFTLNGDVIPKQMQATITDCPKSDFVGKSAWSIYKIEDGTLTMVGNRPGVTDTPKDFAGDETSRRFVFKKAQLAK